MTKRTAMLAIAIAAMGVVGAGQIVTSGVAKAQYYSDQGESSSSYSQGRTPPMPRPGFEGFDGPNTYCSFRREPDRRCYNDRNGEQQCQTVGWRMIQYCY